MSDHTFSNQKSALEDYFESLLEESDESKPLTPEIHSKPVDAIESSLEDSVNKEEQAKEETETEAEIQIESPKISSPVNEPLTPINPRTTIADMLADIETRAVPEPEKEFAEPAAEIIIPMPGVAQEVEVRVEIVEKVVEVIVEPEVVEIVEVEEQLEIEVTTKREVVHETVHEHAGTPEWAESRFQCLLFQVGGLSLAVPLVKLNGVISWSEKVVETPNQTDWYLGVLMNLGNKVEVIDTAVMVLPPEHRKELSAEPSERLSHILLVDEQRWGLACDSIGEVVWLNKDDVKWRSNKTKRPWLLGTAIDHMCAVMDTEAFAEMLGHNK